MELSNAYYSSILILWVLAVCYSLEEKYWSSKQSKHFDPGLSNIAPSIFPHVQYLFELILFYFTKILIDGEKDQLLKNPWWLNRSNERRTHTIITCSHGFLWQCLSKFVLFPDLESQTRSRNFNCFELKCSFELQEYAVVRNGTHHKQIYASVSSFN